MDSAVTSLNLYKICRVCLTESEEMHSIFSEIQNEDSVDEELTYIYEILMNISAVRILAEDRMPTTICGSCLGIANTSYRFQQQCNRSQAILEAFINQLDLNKQDCNKVFNDLETSAKEIEFPDALKIFSMTEQVKENECSLEASTDDLCLEQSCFIDDSDVETCNVLIEDKDHDLVKEDVQENNCSVKFEIKEEAVINATQVATALEHNVKLKEKLALKRIQNNNNKNDQKGSLKRLPRTKFSYYIRLNENGEKTYACNLCDKSYKFGSSLKVHMRTHTLERPYICTLCGKDFKQYGSLSYHLRSHSGEQPYICKICGKRYKQSGSLTAHMRIHTGQRPFLCSVCGRGFRQAPDLGYHMRTHTKEKPYMCSICGKTMSMQCHLVQHMRTHTGERPFKCTECSKAFPSSTRLKRHAIIHTGLKPYSCEVCDRAFNRRSSLRVHAKIHTDERPHVCPICGKGFIQAHSLKSHVITHSSTNFTQLI